MARLGVAVVVWLGNNCPAPDLPRVPRSHYCLADVSTVASNPSQSPDTRHRNTGQVKVMPLARALLGLDLRDALLPAESCPAQTQLQVESGKVKCIEVGGRGVPKSSFYVAHVYVYLYFCCLRMLAWH